MNCRPNKSKNDVSRAACYLFAHNKGTSECGANSPVPTPGRLMPSHPCPCRPCHPCHPCSCHPCPCRPCHPCHPCPCHPCPCPSPTEEAGQTWICAPIPMEVSAWPVEVSACPMEVSAWPVAMSAWLAILQAIGSDRALVPLEVSAPSTSYCESTCPRFSGSPYNGAAIVDSATTAVPTTTAKMRPATPDAASSGCFAYSAFLLLLLLLMLAADLHILLRLLLPTTLTPAPLAAAASLAAEPAAFPPSQQPTAVASAIPALPAVPTAVPGVPAAQLLMLRLSTVDAPACHSLTARETATSSGNKWTLHVHCTLPKPKDRTVRDDKERI